MILYIENVKASIVKLSELINKHSKVAGHKINTQKLLEFLCTCNTQSKNEIKEEKNHLQ